MPSHQLPLVVGELVLEGRLLPEVVVVVGPLAGSYSEQVEAPGAVVEVAPEEVALMVLGGHQEQGGYHWQQLEEVPNLEVCWLQVA